MFFSLSLNSNMHNLSGDINVNITWEDSIISSWEARSSVESSLLIYVQQSIPVPSKPSYWSCINDFNGSITTVTPGCNIAASWYVSDFPPPVGKSPITPFIWRALLRIGNCPGLNSLFRNISCKKYSKCSAVSFITVCPPFTLMVVTGW